MPALNKVKSAMQKKVIIYTAITPETRGFLTAFKRHFKNSTLRNKYPDLGNLVKIPIGKISVSHILLYYLFDKKKKEQEGLTSSNIEKAVSVAILNSNTANVSIVPLLSIPVANFIENKIPLQELNTLRQHSLPKLSADNVRIVTEDGVILTSTNTVSKGTPKVKQKSAPAPADTKIRPPTISAEDLKAISKIPVGTQVTIRYNGKEIGTTKIIRYLLDDHNLNNSRVIFADSFPTEDGNTQKIWKISQITMTPVDTKSQVKTAPASNTFPSKPSTINTPTTTVKPSDLVKQTLKDKITRTKIGETKSPIVETKPIEPKIEYKTSDQFSPEKGNKVIIVTKNTGKRFEGTFVKKNSDGALIVLVGDSKKRFSSEIFISLTEIKPEPISKPSTNVNDEYEDDLENDTPDSTESENKLSNNKIQEINIADQQWKNSDYIYHDLGTIVDVIGGPKLKADVIEKKAVVIAYVCDYLGLRSIKDKKSSDVLSAILTILISKDGNIFLAPVSNLRISTGNQIEKVSADKLIQLRDKVFSDVIQFIDPSFKDKFRNTTVDTGLEKRKLAEKVKDTPPPVIPKVPPTNIKPNIKVPPPATIKAPTPSDKIPKPTSKSPDVLPDKTIESPKPAVIKTEGPKFTPVTETKARPRFQFNEIDLDDTQYKKFLLNAKHTPPIGTITTIIFNKKLLLSEAVIIRYLFDPAKQKVILLTIGKNTTDQSKSSDESKVYMLPVNGLSPAPTEGRVNSSSLVKLYDTCLDLIYEKFIPKKDDRDPVLEQSTVTLTPRERLNWYFHQKGLASRS